MTLLEYLLLICPLVVHLLIDYKGIVRHWLNATYVLLISIAIGIILPGYWFQGTLYALAIHFAFFDPLYNLTHNKNVFYHGDQRNPNRALTDKLWDRTPFYAEVFIRLVVLGAGAGLYHNLEWVTG